MTKIDYENDRMQSVEQIDSAKRLSDKILELKDFEDEIANAEESLKKLKEKNYKLGILSNGTPSLLNKLVKSNNLDNIFVNDEVVYPVWGLPNHINEINNC